MNSKNKQQKYLMIAEIALSLVIIVLGLYYVFGTASDTTDTTSETQTTETTDDSAE